MIADGDNSKKLNAENTKLKRMARAERLPRVVDQYCKGRTCREISLKEGITIHSVYKDLQYARQIFWKRNNEASDRLIFEQAAKLDAAERAAWEGWERSCKDAEETTEEASESNGNKLVKKVKGQSGDPSFLAIVAKIVDQRCKLFKIGQYASEDSGTVVARLIEIVVDNPSQIGQIMEFGEYEKLTDQSKVIDGVVIDKGNADDENTPDPDQ